MGVVHPVPGRVRRLEPGPDTPAAGAAPRAGPPPNGGGPPRGRFVSRRANKSPASRGDLAGPTARLPRLSWNAATLVHRLGLYYHAPPTIPFPEHEFTKVFQIPRSMVGVCS